MIFLRIFLYLVCVCSIGWSVLVFAGPSIVKRLISGYTDGAITASDVSFSPQLNIFIGRLDYNFYNEIAEMDFSGFSRASEITWSVLGEEPFLDLKIGPTILKKYAVADGIQIKTASFQQAGWKNLFFATNVRGLSIASHGTLDHLNIEGILNLELSLISTIKFEAHKFTSQGNNPVWSAGIINGELGELALNAPISQQFFNAKVSSTDVLLSEPNFRIARASSKISLRENYKNVRVDLFDLLLPDSQGSIREVRIDGRFDEENVFNNINIDLFDSAFTSKSPNFPQIYTKAFKNEEGKYQVSIEGNSSEFEISNSDAFLALLPAGNFNIDTELDVLNSAVIANSKIRVSSRSDNDFYASALLGFNASYLSNRKCALQQCEFSKFDLSYKINLNDDWVEGTAVCSEKKCGLKGLKHLVRTSNTIDIFTKLNNANILSPLSSLYLYGAITSGQKLKDGHELRFQF